MLRHENFGSFGGGNLKALRGDGKKESWTNSGYFLANLSVNWWRFSKEEENGVEGGRLNSTLLACSGGGYFCPWRG